MCIAPGGGSFCYPPPKKVLMPSKVKAPCACAHRGTWPCAIKRTQHSVCVGSWYISNVRGPYMMGFLQRKHRGRVCCLRLQPNSTQSAHSAMLLSKPPKGPAAAGTPNPDPGPCHVGPLIYQFDTCIYTSGVWNATAK